MLYLFFFIVLLLFFHLANVVKPYDVALNAYIIKVKPDGLNGSTYKT